MHLQELKKLNIAACNIFMSKYVTVHKVFIFEHSMYLVFAEILAAQVFQLWHSG